MQSAPAPRSAFVTGATGYWGREGDVFIHLVGFAHPSPRKAQAFESVDLASVAAATVTRAQMVRALLHAAAATASGVRVVEVPEARRAR